MSAFVNLYIRAVISSTFCNIKFKDQIGLRSSFYFRDRRDLSLFMEVFPRVGDYQSDTFH
jgi:hypothetical protein